MKLPIGTYIKITNPILSEDRDKIGEIARVIAHGDTSDNVYVEFLDDQYSDPLVGWFYEEFEIVKEEEIMADNTGLAMQIAALDQKIKSDQEVLKKLKTELIEKEGEGVTLDTPLAKVQITASTKDRPTGEFSFGLDPSVFVKQDERIQANLVKQGIVIRTEKVVKGQSPTVKVVKK